MRTALFVVAVLCGLAPLSAAHAQRIEEAGGSNLVTIDLDPNALATAEDWKNSAKFKTPACFLQNGRATIENELRTMYANGQRKLGLMLWFTHSDGNNDCAGFLLRSTGGKLPPQVMKNLISLLGMAKQIGYDRVQIRFAPMGGNAPSSWTSWNNAMAEENWSVIRSTITAVDHSEKPPAIYDLSVELGGLSGPKCSQCAAYVTHIWQQYLQAFGPENSYGTSIAAGPGRLEKLIDELHAAGSVPPVFGLDIYDNARGALVDAAKEARARGIKNPQFIIQETFYNDPATYNAFIAAAKESRVNIRYIMQWPLQTGQHRNISLRDTPAYIYRPTP